MNQINVVNDTVNCNCSTTDGGGVGTGLSVIEQEDNGGTS
jgi:hypothetical protein